MSKPLPKLPVPKLEDTMTRYLRALEGLQDDDEHLQTSLAVNKFLTDPAQGPRLQRKLEEYNEGVESYIEEWWYESYLSQTESVVLSLNPFFILSQSPTPAPPPPSSSSSASSSSSNHIQLKRASSLILSSLSFIHDLRHELLSPDIIRGGKKLDMSQYARLFGTARIPGGKGGCEMKTEKDSRHVVVIRRGQIYYMTLLDSQNRPLVTEHEIERNLRAIMDDADRTAANEAARGAVGVLTTENRKQWSRLRETLTKDEHNASCLSVVDSALFVVCLDDDERIGERGIGGVCEAMLCGSYKLEGGVQVGTCTNRWYDKLQIIVCADGEAGINFEHTGVDGHTVLRYAADIYTDLVLLFAKSINPASPTLFKSQLSPFARSRKSKQLSTTVPAEEEDEEEVDTTPKKLTWHLTGEIRMGIRFAETRLSDLICQHEVEALEFAGYGKEFITRHGLSPDAFVQMAFQAAYYSLYGRIESTYEPAMTKAFNKGRTEAIRTVQPNSVAFTKLFCTSASASEKIAALRKACKSHTELTKECSAGFGQDRHLYALYCLLQREIQSASSSSTSSPTSDGTSTPPPAVPELFSDPGYSLLSTSILSTSNCGNPALRLFGFAEVTPEGYGIGYIIKDSAISICAASKHLQTRRFLDTLSAVLFDLQRMLKQLYLEANRSPLKNAPPPAPMLAVNGSPSTERGAKERKRTFLVKGSRRLDSLDELEEKLELEALAASEAEESLEGYGYFELPAEESRRERHKRIGIALPTPEY